MQISILSLNKSKMWALQTRENNMCLYEDIRTISQNYPLSSFGLICLSLFLHENIYVCLENK